MGRCTNHGFRQETCHQQDRAEAEKRHPKKGRAPAERHLQDAAERRRHDRRERRDRAHAGELAAGANALIEIAHDGARQYRSGRHAEGLQAAQRRQHLNRARKDAAKADRAVERESGQQHRLAADMIRDRPIDNLADCKADEIAGQGQLHLRHRRAEHAPDLRQRRQVEVDRHRADRSQERQKCGQRQGIGTKHGALLGHRVGKAYV
jgi:hypothetical protein